jgi:hypothetical protein
VAPAISCGRAECGVTNAVQADSEDHLGVMPWKSSSGLFSFRGAARSATVAASSLHGISEKKLHRPRARRMLPLATNYLTGLGNCSVWITILTKANKWAFDLCCRRFSGSARKGISGNRLVSVNTAERAVVIWPGPDRMGRALSVWTAGCPLRNM